MTNVRYIPCWAEPRIGRDFAPEIQLTDDDGTPIHIDVIAFAFNPIDFDRYSVRDGVHHITHPDGTHAIIVARDHVMYRLTDDPGSHDPGGEPMRMSFRDAVLTVLQEARS